MNGVCVCVSSTYVVGWCEGNNAICLVLAVGYVFLKADKKQERSVIHVKIVPFVLMRINVCDYQMYLVCAFLYFWGCIENERGEIFYENVWGNSIAIGKENLFECVFFHYCPLLCSPKKKYIYCHLIIAKKAYLLFCLLSYNYC